MGGSLKVSKKSSERFWNPLGHYGRQAVFGTKTPQKKGKGGGGSSYDPMMEYMSQMQSAQASQAEAARKAQEEAFIESQKQSAAAAAQQGELGAKQLLAQTGAMQQARDIAAKEAQQQAYGAMGQAAVGEGFDISKARQEQAANLAGTGAIPAPARLPFYGMTDTANTEAGATGKYANIFNLPKTQGITFGGV